jgi:hypothetical protein
MKLIRYISCTVLLSLFLSSCVGNGNGQIACFSKVVFGGDFIQSANASITGSRAKKVTTPIISTASPGGCGLVSINADNSPFTSSIEVVFKQPSADAFYGIPRRARHEIGGVYSFYEDVQFNITMFFRTTAYQGPSWSDMESCCYDSFGELLVETSKHSNAIASVWQEVQLAR